MWKFLFPWGGRRADRRRIFPGLGYSFGALGRVLRSHRGADLRSSQLNRSSRPHRARRSKRRR
jgi:hypothetical protein